MTDLDLIEKKLLRIEAAVTDIRTLSQPERIGGDLREERFVLHTLQIGIQAAIDVASHIISDQRLGEPRAARDVFTILSRHQIIDVALSERLVQMVGFRNVVVHQYDDVDLSIVQRIVAENLDDLLAFVTIVREKFLTPR